MNIKKLLLYNLAIASLLIVCIMLDLWNLIPKLSYTASDFLITEYISPIDYDQDGIDDAHDLLYGARKYAESGLKYKSDYYDGLPEADACYLQRIAQEVVFSNPILWNLKKSL